MLTVIALVASIAALDSLNPSTIAPAVVLATGRNARRDVAAFALGVFAVSTAGGLILLFGPGRVLLHAIGKPTGHTQHLLETVSGAVLVAVAAALWRYRGRVWRPSHSRPALRGRSAGLLGAAIMAVELPTAFPYFAAIVAVAGGIHAAPGQASVIVLYNAIFVAPLVAVGLVALFSPRHDVERLRGFIFRYASVGVPVIVGTIGCVLIAVGASRL